ncbi:hypothetical protein TH63_17330 [Rufibacter radiotolerans]|uniref:Tetratricopeptide repeat protein n=1 Tax=Rufibacter radiotolerans TaxID=1379910 RepID=A0A0H4VNW9_9BACT|nr:tetratricopeptide repeat protein [Rufibacter radiotolerans]AKQ47003.1 hypothetical protein TH63_17330 [Rufibacter radiotolerans]
MLPRLIYKSLTNSIAYFLPTLFGLLLLMVPVSAQKRAIEMTVASTEARAALVAGRELAENQHHDKAQKYFTKVITKDPACAIAYLYLAQSVAPASTAYVNNLKQAITLMGKASEGERALIEVEKAQAEGHVTKTKELLQKLVRQYPTDKRVFLAVSGHYLRLLDYTEAEAALTAGMALDPDFPPFSLWLGHIAATKGQFPIATQALQTYQKLLPDEPNSFLATGHLYLKRGFYTEAIKSFTTALDLDPQFYQAYGALGMAYLANDQLTEARNQAEKLLGLAPNTTWRRQAYYALIGTYLEESKLHEALASLAKSRELAEKDKDSWEIAQDMNLVGDIHLSQGKVNEATAQYQSALKVMETADAFIGMKNQARLTYLTHATEVGLATNDLAAARRHITEYRKLASLQQTPGLNQELHRLLGLVALVEKKYEAAAQEFAKSSQQDPRTFHLLGNIHLAQGDQAQAKLNWMAAAQLNDPTHSYLLLRRKAKQ